MWRYDYGIFLGREEEQIIVEFVAADNFFLILIQEDASSKETARSILKELQEKVQSQKPNTLASFNEVLTMALSKAAEESKISVAGGLLVDEVLYLKTTGTAEIYLYRQDKLAPLISLENTASGFIKHDDLFIFTVRAFSNLISLDDLKKRLTDRTPKEIVDEVTPLLKEKDDSGAIALFVRFYKAPVFTEETAAFSTETTVLEETPKKNIIAKFQGKLHGVVERLRASQTHASKNKKLTLIAIVILFLILIWSIVFGYQRRERAKLREEVKQSQEKINQKISEAADVSLLNLKRAQILLSEARIELADLKKKIGKNKIDEIQNIEENIIKSEKEILKQEDKKAEVFYDLKLIEDKATAVRMYKDKDLLALLNADLGKIYLLNLDKKSTKTIKKEEIKGATLVALYNDEVIFYSPSRGIYKIDADNQLTQAVKKDDQWGKITDLWIYNGNLYVLDSGKDEIYKYLVAEAGYSAKTSYFKSGQAVKLEDDASIAIDSSLYIASKDRVFKYVSGVRDEFKVTFPDEEVRSLNKIFTDKNTNKIYVLDKTKAKLYVISKEGQYEKQIESAIFKNAADIVVYDPVKSVYVLIGDKIYKIAI